MGRLLLKAFRSPQVGSLEVGAVCSGIHLGVFGRLLCGSIQGTIPGACCPAACHRDSTATIPKAKLHSKGPSTHLCSVLDLLALVLLLLVPRKTVLDCFQPATAARLVRKLPTELSTAFHSIIRNLLFSSTSIRAKGVSTGTAIHSSRMSWSEIAKASALSCEPSPTCLIAVMSAAISPSLSTNSRPRTFAQSLPSE